MSECITLPAGTKLDLGSGPRPKPGFRGVDIEAGLTDYQLSFDTGLPWPFEDDAVDELRACHVIEHIDAAYGSDWVKVSRSDSRDGPFLHPLDAVKGLWIERGGWLWQKTSRRKDLLFHFFDEAFRVIKPGGRFEVRWPNVFDSEAHGDPTHRRQISEMLHLYLNRRTREQLGVGFYNVTCNWVGSCHFERRLREDDIGAEELERRIGREINVCEEIVMLLAADKS